MGPYLNAAVLIERSRRRAPNTTQECGRDSTDDREAERGIA